MFFFNTNNLFIHFIILNLKYFFLLFYKYLFYLIILNSQFIFLFFIVYKNYFLYFIQILIHYKIRDIH
jgi:hypothetical protein